MSDPADDAVRAQRERAQQAWELVVEDGPEPQILAALRKVLRVKRRELPALAGSLPGVVRRGAEIDLAPLAASLREASVRSSIRRRKATPGD